MNNVPKFYCTVSIGFAMRFVIACNDSSLGVTEKDSGQHATYSHMTDTTGSGQSLTESESSAIPTASSEVGGGESSSSTSEDMSAEVNEEIRMELDSADLSILTKIASFAEKSPVDAIEVAPDVGEKLWQDIKSDPQYNALHSALLDSGASEQMIAAALRSSAYYGSGQAEDPIYQQWASLRNSLIADARSFMEALEQYEAQNNVQVNREYIDQMTRLPSIANWKMENR